MSCVRGRIFKPAARKERVNSPSEAMGVCAVIGRLTVVCMCATPLNSTLLKSYELSNKSELLGQSLVQQMVERYLLTTMVGHPSQKRVVSQPSRIHAAVNPAQPMSLVNSQTCAGTLTWKSLHPTWTGESRTCLTWITPKANRPRLTRKKILPMVRPSPSAVVSIERERPKRAHCISPSFRHMPPAEAARRPYFT